MRRVGGGGGEASDPLSPRTGTGEVSGDGDVGDKRSALRPPGGDELAIPTDVCAHTPIDADDGGACAIVATTATTGEEEREGKTAAATVMR